MKWKREKNHSGTKIIHLKKILNIKCTQENVVVRQSSLFTEKSTQATTHEDCIEQRRKNSSKRNKTKQKE